MKVIGDINAIDETYQGYEGGKLIALTCDEFITLASLQEATDGLCPPFSSHPILRNKNMDNAFFSVLVFTRARFFVNEFDGLLKNLKDLMIKKFGDEDE